MNTALIIGANGRLGRSSVEAFVRAGWTARAFVRQGSGDRVPHGVEVFEGDVCDATCLASAVQGADVIVNCVNPPYERWEAELGPITRSVLSAAKLSGATVLLPGNVYNYGAQMPSRLFEDTPHVPSTNKGALRETMETAYREAAAEGVQTIVLRAGDFLEGARTGNWFDTYIAHRTHCGTVTYPGPVDRMHAWAYLPDVATALVGLAEARRSLGPFEIFGFEGFSMTGAELIAAMEGVLGRQLRFKRFPWSVVRLLGLFHRPMREVVEMRYLWEVPHAVDGSKLAHALPAFQPTPLREALQRSLEALTQDSFATGAPATV